MIQEPLDVYIDTVADNVATSTILAWQADGKIIRKITPPAGLARGAHPERLIIGHTTAGRGVNLRDRHVIRVEGPSIDGSSGADVYGTHQSPTVYVVVDVGRSFVHPDFAVTAMRYLVGLIRGAEANAATEDTPDYNLVFTKVLGGES